MEKLLFQDISPFVRYSRLLNNTQDYTKDLCAYDCRLLYCTKGKGTMTINEKIYPAYAGMLFLWKSGIPYRYTSDQHNPMQFFAINFDFTNEYSHLSIPIPPDYKDNYNKHKQLESFSFTDALLFNEPLILPSQHHLSERLMELNKEYQEQKIYYQQRCSGLLLNILAQLSLAGVSQNVDTNKTVDAIIAYMIEHHEERITNQQLGEVFGYHPNYLNQLFTKYTRKSMYRYLQNIRIMHATSLLQNTDLPVLSISKMVGFDDFPHFSRYFKEQTGYTPSDFRLK